MNFRVHPNEALYCKIMMMLSCLVYGGCAYALYYLPFNAIVYTYAILFLLIMTIFKVLLVGHLRGNSIKVTQRQFPEIFTLVEAHCTTLGLSKMPDVYVMQSGGMLNAFALKFSKRDYVVLYSDILELAYQEGTDALSFIIGHELGHVAMQHTGFWKSSFMLPARLIPFLGKAYSRACEYTCDAIGHHLVARGAIKGILVLAAGKRLYTKVNVPELLATAQQQAGFVTRYTELLSTHPLLVKRIEALHTFNQENLVGDEIFVSPTMRAHETELQ